MISFKSRLLALLDAEPDQIKLNQIIDESVAESGGRHENEMLEPGENIFPVLMSVQYIFLTFSFDRGCHLLLFMETP